MRLKLLVASIPIGLASGVASALFLKALEWVSEYRADNPDLLWYLPAAGLALGAVFGAFGAPFRGGNRKTMTEIASLTDGVPLRMAPMVLLGTVWTHLFGGSAGREGTALQMSAGMTDGVARRLGLDTKLRSHLLVIALAGGFGSVFGVPWAGIVFALEVAPAKLRVRWRSMPGAVIASFLGAKTVDWLGVSHSHYPQLGTASLLVLVKIAAAGVCFGLAAWVFIRLTEAIKGLLDARVANSAVRPLIGGVAVVALTVAVGNRDYNGLSLPLLNEAFTPGGVIGIAFALKLIMTATTVGSGFQGGEVTPLFVIGGTLGSVLATPLGAPTALMAGVGMMAVFGSAANASLACVAMGIELFGWDAALPLVVACGTARLFSSKRHLYEVLEAVPDSRQSNA